jgi:DnaK suppressor protein
MSKHTPESPEGGPPSSNGDQFSPEELEELEALLMNRRAFLLGNVQKLEDEAAQRGPEEHSNSSVHIAEHATDAYLLDISLAFIENQSGRLRDIDDALERLHDGSYGRCEMCDNLVAIDRLRAVPYARCCVPCQSEQEKAEG